MGPMYGYFNVPSIIYNHSRATYFTMFEAREEILKIVYYNEYYKSNNNR